MVVLVTSNAVVAMALDDLDHSSHIAIAEMKELKDQVSSLKLLLFVLGSQYEIRFRSLKTTPGISKALYQCN